MGKDLFDFLCAFPFRIYFICETIDEVEFQTAAFQKKQNRSLKYGLIDEEAYDFRKKETIITSDLNELPFCNLVIEAINEDLFLKQKLFQKLDQVISNDCVLVSNTSSISPDDLFTGLKHRDKSMGLHFFFPVSMKDWVEINLTDKSDEQSVLFAQKFLDRIGKKYLLLKGNNQFIINRIFLKMQAACCQIFAQGKMSVQDIDSLVKVHLFPIGVFEFFDHVGIDVMLQSVMSYIQFEANTEYFHPMIQLLNEKQKSEKLRLKTKSGFYDYPIAKDESVPNDTDESSKFLEEITFAYLDGVFDVLNRGLCSQQELEQIILNYMMLEKSPFELANEVGYTPK